MRSPAQLHPPTVPTRRPIVGAIRWDAWIGEVPNYDVGLQVERTLGPRQWHSRLPFFAEELSATAVRVRANTQTVMDQEITYAHAAGLYAWNEIDEGGWLLPSLWPEQGTARLDAVGALLRRWRGKTRSGAGAVGS